MSYVLVVISHVLTYMLVFNDYNYILLQIAVPLIVLIV